MSAPMRISLRAGERIYINGAVLRADRKLTFELLNTASFLLENHIIQADEATTPLRQVYFALQTMLIEPSSKLARDAYARIYAATLASFSTSDVVVGLKLVGKLVDGGRIYEALKTLRSLFAVEAAILQPETGTPSQVPIEEQYNGREQHDKLEQRGDAQVGDERLKQYG